MRITNQKFKVADVQTFNIKTFDFKPSRSKINQVQLVLSRLDSTKTSYNQLEINPPVSCDKGGPSHEAPFLQLESTIEGLRDNNYGTSNEEQIIIRAKVDYEQKNKSAFQ